MPGTRPTIGATMHSSVSIPSLSTREVRRRIATAAFAVAVLLAAAPARALPIDASVGTGPDLATVVLEFQDGAGYAFEVSFDDAIETSGLEIMQLLDAELPSFSLTILDFGFGLFIDAIAYDGHSDGGFGGGELFWHYWTKDLASDPWTFSQIGAVDRIVADGAWEGWRFSGGAPVPEPGTAVLVALGLVGLARFRAQRAAVD
jgi:hypothetical protein